MHRAHTRIVLALATAVAASACAAKLPVKVDQEVWLPAQAPGEARLINEGGPVFLTGEVTFPSYFKGSKEGLTVNAERLNGSVLTEVKAAPLSAENTFELQAKTTTGMFFAGTVVTHEDSLHRIRTLVKPEDGHILIDTASTLVAAKVMLAARGEKMAELKQLHAATTDLMDYIRTAVPPAELGTVRLDQTNQDLSTALDALAAQRPDLDYKLHAWEETLHANTSKPLIAPAVAPPPSRPVIGPPPK